LRFDRRLVGFGLFLVTVGVVMVAVRQGLIPVDTARRAWSLWPLVLIGLGLSMILAGRPGAWVGGLIVAMWLPSRTLSGDLTVNAGSVALCLPTGAGLRVSTGGNVAASNDFETHGLVRSGDTWETPGFASATARIDLMANANAASLSLDPAACTTAG
jgi:hypothetical protein